MKISQGIWVAFTTLLSVVSSEGSSSDSKYVEKATTSGVKYRELASKVATPKGTRKYSHLLLANGLQVALVSDPEGKQASVRMGVEVGYQSDPENVSGLAHFCEHMLFQGTKKYPQVDEYDEYLSKNSGSSNGETRYDSTSYLQSVSPEALNGSLDRFSQFFISPLFNQDSTMKEAKIVDSEFNISFTNVLHRSQLVRHSLAPKEHPYGQFGYGNYNSLITIPKSKNINTVAELKKFHKKFYSANLMKLAILSTQPIDKLIEMVVPKFSPIVNRNVTRPNDRISPIRAEDKMTIINLVSSGTVYFIELNFMVRPVQKYFDSDPTFLVSQLLNSKGPGSLYATLENKGWATKLIAKVSEDFENYSDYIVQITATDDGIKNYIEVTKLIFEYINLIGTKGINNKQFNEMKQLKALEDKYGPPKDPVDVIGYLIDDMMINKPVEKLFDHTLYPNVFNESLSKDFINQLSPSNMRITVIAPHENKNVKYQVEFWAKTKFTVSPVPKKVMTMWNSTFKIPSHCNKFSGLKLPPPNPWIPTNFDVISQKSNSTVPELVVNKNGSSLAYSTLNTDKPKALVGYILRDGLLKRSPQTTILVKVLSKVIENKITEKFYTTKSAGLEATVADSGTAISMNVLGFSHKLPKLTKLFIDVIRELKITSAEFRSAVRDAKDSLNDFDNLIGNVFGALQREDSWLSEDYKKVFQGNITLKALNDFKAKFLSGAFVESLALGNIKVDEAKGLLEYCKHGLNAKGQMKPPPRKLVTLPSGKDWVYELPDPDPTAIVSTVNFYIQTGKFSDPKGAAYTQIINAMLTQPTYNQLRTQDQLGYFVLTQTSTFGDGSGILFYIRSKRHPDYVESRIENLLKIFVNSTRKLTDKDFQSFKASALDSFKGEYDTLELRTKAFMSLASSQKYGYESIDRTISEIKSASKEAIIKLVTTHLAKGSALRKKLSLHIMSPEAAKNNSSSSKFDSGTIIKDVYAWKAGLLAKATKSSG